MLRQDTHIFQGMRQDNHPLNQKNEFLWEAHNIRFTAMDGSTLLSMTNERGNYPIFSVSGKYIGHCVVGNYLVLFVENTENSSNLIYRIKINSEISYEYTTLYSGSLNMTSDYPAQTLGIYEGEFVQKVYWVDGKNQPRVINITADKLLGLDINDGNNRNIIYPDGCFNFVRELSLNETISIERHEGGGVFAPGVIQYAFSYYSKYGQESNIFYTSELLYTSHPNRGASPEDTTSNIFKITIKNPEPKFNFLKIYSVIRTSIDATPAVKIIADVEITDNNDIIITDTGNIGSSIDPTKLLYIGGESIIANTLEEKDGTLFLGNIEIIRDAIPNTIKDSLKNYVDNNKLSTSIRTITLEDSVDVNSIYTYTNQLSKGNITTFKIGDYYRLGVQFQHINGKWSEPVWLGDYQIPRTSLPYRKEKTLGLPYIYFTLEDSIVSSISALGYKKVRPLIVLPSIYDRMVLAQGILCPTVFSVKDRLSNSPFAESSWFFRPMMSGTINNTTNIEKGATVTFGHLSPLLGLDNRGAEIQNMFYTAFTNANNSAKADNASEINTFYVDQSILTMHSPDIEFNDSVRSSLEDNNFNLHIVGLTGFKSNAGEISIQTSSQIPAPNDTGFYHKSFTTYNYENKSLVAGMFYKSHLIDETSDAKSFSAYKPNNADWELNWLVYPWHRTGSLNNDLARDSDKGVRTSVLEKKTISNIKFSPDNVWFDSNHIWKAESGLHVAGITAISIFNSDEVTLTKLQIPQNSGIDTLNYFGNVDSLVTSNNSYEFYIIPNSGKDPGSTSVKVVNPFTHTPLQTISTNYKRVGDYAEQLSKAKDPVRIKYKSSPHAIFSFNYLSNNSPVILPNINGTINKYEGTNDIPFWSKIDENDVNAINTISSEAPSIYTEITVEYIQTYPSTITEKGVLEDCEDNLNILYPYGSQEDNQLCITASAYKPLDKTCADIWIYTPVAPGDAWTRLDLSDKLGDYYHVYYDSEDIFWRVELIAEGEYVLRKISGESYRIYQDTITVDNPVEACLYLAELIRPSKPTNMFGGTTDEALRSNSWIPAGPIVELNDIIRIEYGDTYYQRYDCLKTYPFTNMDENGIVEIASFMCETKVNIDGRYDRNRGQLDNLNMTPTNFNLLNDVYSQSNNFFNYRILEDQYYKNTKYPMQILWSMQKTNLEDIDTWTNITLANATDLSGNFGPLESIENINGTLVAFQDKAISRILFNSRVEIPTSDGVPVEISNNYKVDGTTIISDTIGCQDKWTIAKTPSGLYFIDSYTDTLYLFGERLDDISNTKGGKFWMKKYHITNKWKWLGEGSIRLSYDRKNKDLYLSPTGDILNRNTLCFSEQLGVFTSLMSYSDTVMFSLNDGFYSLKDSNNNIGIWENFKGDYNDFFGQLNMPDFTYICNNDALYTKVFDTIEYSSDRYDLNGNLLHNSSFDYIRAYNEYQDSGIKVLTQSREITDKNFYTSLRKKFRLWRSQIPRQGRERMRNNWTAITLGFGESSFDDNKFKFILHNISTKYTL